MQAVDVLNEIVTKQDMEIADLRRQLEEANRVALALSQRADDADDRYRKTAAQLAEAQQEIAELKSFQANYQHATEIERAEAQQQLDAANALLRRVVNAFEHPSSITETLVAITAHLEPKGARSRNIEKDEHVRDATKEPK